MPLRRRQSGVWVDAVPRRRSGGTWVTVNVNRRSGSTFTPVTLGSGGGGTPPGGGGGGTPPGGGGGGTPPALSGPTSASGLVELFDGPWQVNVTSNVVTMTPSGGNGTYTYSWTRISGDSSIFVSAPTGNSVTFSGLVSQNSSISATFRCTVTSGGQTATMDVSVTLTYVWYFGGGGFNPV